MFRGNFYNTDPSRSSSTIMPSSNAPTSTVTVSLTSNRSADQRTIDIRPGEDLIIGRASRSELKNLQAAANNALFDCPVVSRVHAALRSTGDDKSIHITDRSSLHGTSVNGHRLSPGVPFSLHQGDIIKLGERVTRGDDTHDGVSLTFNRVENQPSSYLTTTFSASRGFSVPSHSDAEASDLDSDSESIHNDTSSAYTTPEQIRRTKPSVGTQHAPIDLDPFPVAQSNVIMLPEEDDGLAIIPESERDQAAEDDGSADEGAYDNTGLSDHLSERATALESDLADELEDDLDSQSDSVSDSAASDIANTNADGELSPGNRPVSPELGDSEAGQLRPIVNPFVDAQLPRGNIYQPARYDPVRNSQQPVEDLSRHMTDLRGHYKAPASGYTYGSFGYGNVPDSTTNLQTSSRWDVPPMNRGSIFPVDNTPINQYGAPPVFSYGTDPMFGRPPMPAPPPPPAAQSCGADWGSAGPMQSPLPPIITPTVTGKISIDDIVSEGPKRSLANAQAVVDHAAPSSAALKRKADDDVAEEAAPGCQPEAKRQKSDSTQSTYKPRSTLRRLAENTGVAALGSIMGAIGTVVFLNSDLSQTLIDRLA